MLSCQLHQGSLVCLDIHVAAQIIDAERRELQVAPADIGRKRLLVFFPEGKQMPVVFPDFQKLRFVESLAVVEFRQGGEVFERAEDVVGPVIAGRGFPVKRIIRKRKGAPQNIHFGLVCRMIAKRVV